MLHAGIDETKGEKVVLMMTGIFLMSDDYDNTELYPKNEATNHAGTPLSLSLLCVVTVNETARKSIGFFVV